MADSNEDRLLRSALGRTAECLPVERLADLDADGRAHVEHCRYCQNELAMMAEFMEATPRPEEAASVAWIQSELERRSAEGGWQAKAPTREKAGGWQAKAPAPRWLGRVLAGRGWQMLPVAAALLLLVGGGIYLRQGEPGLRPPAGGEQVWRSNQFAAVAPVGDVAAAPTELQWAGAPSAGKYLVQVMEVDRTEIWRAESTGTRIELPAEIRRQMTAGRSFLWKISAHDAAGATVAETGLQTFHILTTSR